MVLHRAVHGFVHGCGWGHLWNCLCMGRNFLSPVRPVRFCAGPKKLTGISKHFHMAVNLAGGIYVIKKFVIFSWKIYSLNNSGA